MRRVLIYKWADLLPTPPFLFSPIPNLHQSSLERREKIGLSGRNLFWRWFKGSGMTWCRVIGSHNPRVRVCGTICTISPELTSLFVGCIFFIGIVKEALKFLSVESSVSVLCLGLGSPSASPNSRAQLAFLIELCVAFNIVGQQYCSPSLNSVYSSFLIKEHTSVSIYDPVFTPEDIELFRSLQFQILSVSSSCLYNSSYRYLPSWTVHFSTIT